VRASGASSDGRHAPSRSPVGQGAPGVVRSSRVRLARNVSGYRFPLRASDAELCELNAEVGLELATLPALSGARYLLSGGQGHDELVALAESWLVSTGAVSARFGGALVGDDGVSVVFNDEDHLRLQVVLPGCAIGEAWRRVQVLDEQVGEHVVYAYMDGPGYLTSCPSNLGTGLRASVMVALPGLHILGECDAVLRGLNAMGYAVRGAYGEGSEPAGPLFQISNQATLGVTEEELLDAFELVVADISSCECHARGRLMEQQPLRLVDYCARSLAMVRYAKLVSALEALALLGGLRVGVECGIVRGVDLKKLCSLMVAVQPMHLAMESDVGRNGIDRDQARAALLKGALRAAVLEKAFR
jgi:protein arginine kinase